MLIVVTAAGADSPPAREVGTDIVEGRGGRRYVYNVTSLWIVPLTASRRPAQQSLTAPGLRLPSTSAVAENDAQNHAQPCQTKPMTATVSPSVPAARRWSTPRSIGEQRRPAGGGVDRDSADFLERICVQAVGRRLPMAQAVLAVVIDGRIATRYVCHRVSTFALNLSTASRAGHRLTRCLSSVAIATTA